MAHIQVTFFLSEDDPSKVRAESPGKNGTRLKLGEFSIRELPDEARFNLLAQAEQERDRKKRELQAIQRTNMTYVAAKHGLPFAEQIFQRTLRLHKGNLNQDKPVKKQVEYMPVLELDALD